MAGAGWRAFTRQVLPSSVVQGYLMDQTLMVFASAANRTAQLTAPSDGMLTYLEDTDRLELRSGGAWRLLWQPSNTGTAETLAISSILTGWSVASALGRILGDLGWVAVQFTRTGAALAATTTSATANLTLGALPAKYVPVAPVPLSNFGQGRIVSGYANSGSGNLILSGFGGSSGIGTGETIELGAIYPLANP